MLPINVKWEFSENCGELIARTIPIDAAQINGNANNPNGLHQDTTSWLLFPFHTQILFHIKHNATIKKAIVIMEQ